MVLTVVACLCVVVSGEDPEESDVGSNKDGRAVDDVDVELGKTFTSK